MFNKVIKGMEKNDMNEYKEKVLMFSNKIIEIFVNNDLQLSEINDIMQTVANHTQRNQLLLTAKEVFKKRD